MLISILYGSMHRTEKIHAQEITAVFSPSSLQPHQSPFQKGLLYKGKLSNSSFQIPISIYTKDLKSDRPVANQNYVVFGQIHPRGPNDYVFKIKEWQSIKNSWSLAEMRYQVKERFKNFLSQHLSSTKACSFLCSVSTGDVEDRMLRYEFSRLGLQHILAISGFHFGILVAFCSFALRLFLSRTGEIFLLFLCVNAYYLFVGSSPAIERSYLTALFYLLGRWWNLPSKGINLLGCALGAELIADPLVSSNIGFQLSFSSCLAILIFMPPFEKWIHPILPKRTWKEIQLLNAMSKHGYLLSSFLRKSASLTLAVNIVLFPILLFHFHQFPLLSFLYNLFFPCFVGVSLFLLLSSMVFYLLFPPVADFLFWITNGFTSFLLDLTSYPPFILDFTIRSNSITATHVILYLFLLLFLRISGTHILDLLRNLSSVDFRVLLNRFSDSFSGG